MWHSLVPWGVDRGTEADWPVPGAVAVPAGRNQDVGRVRGDGTYARGEQHPSVWRWQRLPIAVEDVDVIRQQGGLFPGGGPVRAAAGVEVYPRAVVPGEAEFQPVGRETRGAPTD